MSPRRRSGNSDDADPLERKFRKQMRWQRRRACAGDDSAAARLPESELTELNDEELEAIEQEDEESGP